MQSIDDQSVLESPTAAPAISGRWLLRRLILWALIVALGVTGACLLYRLASGDETDTPVSAIGQVQVART
jgi:hypothetical protein